jgi:crotonobetainyl-CoA:carnitine CoA-transferase CaiB-like acyl-CoA transferase
MPQPDPHYWPRFCEAVGRPEWATDERYRDLASRREHTVDLTAQIDAIFAGHDSAYWAARLDEHGLIWAPVAKLPDVVADPQAREMGWFTTLEHPEHGPFETLSTPFHIYGADIGPRRAAPAAGEHTFEVLAELGIDGDDVAKLAADGVLG